MNSSQSFYILIIERSKHNDRWEQFLKEIKGIVAAPRLLEHRFATVLDYCFDSLTSALPLLRGMLFETHQRGLLRANLEKLCRLLEGILGEGKKLGLLKINLDGESLRVQIKITVFGILSSVALVQDEALEEEIRALKSRISKIFQEQLRSEPPE